MWELFSIVFVFAGLFAWSALNHYYSFGGVWERVELDAQSSSKTKSERFSLTQLGPFVTGVGNLLTGHQHFFGVSFGPWLWLKRRDFGVKHFQKQGYPQSIAVMLDGQAFARYRLSLTSDRLFLKGEKNPYTVDYSQSPAAIKKIEKGPSESCTFRRSELVGLEDSVAVTRAVSPAKQS